MQAIRAFLGAVRDRLRRRSLTGAALWGASALVVLAVAAPLGALAIDRAHARELGAAAALAAALAAVAALWRGIVRPARRWRTDGAVARRVGRAAPAVASGLLSAVELADLLDEGGGASPARRFSRSLAEAHLEATARALGGLDAGALVPARPLRRPGLAFAAAALAAAAAWSVAGGRLVQGYRRLATAPPRGPFSGADMTAGPLVGDLDITLDYPRYTGRAPVTLPASSGELVAMPGTAISIHTTALAPAASAQIVFDRPAGGKTPPPIRMQVRGRRLSATFVVTARRRYRFLLAGADGHRRVEASARTIDIEPDKTPTVELDTPAPDLDVTNMKRIELAYIAADDYGIAKVELVWNDGSGPQRKQVPLPEPGRRHAQSKFLWDLADVTLAPGAHVAYHLEVTDNDDVLGPNVGKSRVYHLRVFSPRERHEQVVARQREVFESMVHTLGARLVVAGEDLDAHRELAGETARLAVDLGGVVAAMREDKLASKSLVRLLDAMRERIGKLGAHERALLSRIHARPGDHAPSHHDVSRLDSSDRDQISELENDVLTLDDWLDREQMEDLLSLSDTIKSHQKRLSELMKEYARTHSKAIRNEIDRELRALDQKLAEMRAKQAALPEDVLDRFVNREALVKHSQADCMEKVRKLLDAGDIKGAEAEMKTCSAQLNRSAGALEHALHDLRSDKFSAQQRAFGEVMNRLADLAHDQKQIADDADAIWKRYADRAAKLMKNELKQTRDKLSGLVDELGRRVKAIPPQGLTPFSRAELGTVKARVADLKRMLAAGDLAEALSMARQAESGLEAIQAQLQSVLEQHDPWSDKTKDAARAVRRAQPIAARVVDALANATPSPQQIMSKQDLDRLGELRRRQAAARGRARKLAAKAAKEAGRLPGNAGASIAHDLRQAGQRMRRAEVEMRERHPSGAREQARAAAKKLAEARGRARSAARRGMGAGNAAGLENETVRIPGANEYAPPAKFRQQLLEAMKKHKASGKYRKMIERYYKELIQ